MSAADTLSPRASQRALAAEKGLLRAPDVVRLAGITYRQLDYMVRTGRIEVALPAEGSGSTRYFDPEVVDELVAHYRAVAACPNCARRSRP